MYRDRGKVCTNSKSNSLSFLLHLLVSMLVHRASSQVFMHFSNIQFVLQFLPHLPMKSFEPLDQRLRLNKVVVLYQSTRQGYAYDAVTRSDCMGNLI